MKVLVACEFSGIVRSAFRARGHDAKSDLPMAKNLPLLQATNIVEGRYARVHRANLNKHRFAERARTLTGIANAMADQWG